MTFPQYIRGGADGVIIAAIEELQRQVQALAAGGVGGGTPLKPAFMVFTFTDPTVARPDATSVLWIGPSQPTNATDADLYQPS